LASLDGLIVAYQHLIDEAGNAGRYGHLIGLQIGVICALHKAAPSPKMYEPDDEKHHEHGCAYKENAGDQRIFQRRRFFRLIFWGFIPVLITMRGGGLRMLIGHGTL